MCCNTVVSGVCVRARACQYHSYWLAWQVLIGGKPGVVGDELERELFVLRKAVEAEKDAKLPADKAFDFYTCSLSCRTIIYKVSGTLWLPLCEQAAAAGPVCFVLHPLLCVDTFV